MNCSIALHPEYTKSYWEDHSPDQKTLDRRKRHVLTCRQKTLRALVTSLPDRPESMGRDEQEWLARSYPVLSIFAPTMSSEEGKIEYPGDPMALYAALSYAVQQVVTTRQMSWTPGAPYNDLCPQWGYLPSGEYRLSVDDSGIRTYDAPMLNTDQTVFDPRVWNARVKEYFVEQVLAKIQPRVVLISAVSPAHRYAIEIAHTVKQHLPDCLVVLGGRHADETVRFDASSEEIVLEPSSLVSKVQEGVVGRYVDFLVSGQGYHALDLLMKAISLSMDIPAKTASTDDVIRTLSEFAPVLGPVAGRSILVGFGSDGIHAFPVSGPKIRLQDLPSPYSAFAIRARFPIFERDGHVARTAHFMVTNSCPYHCYFCSEGAAVVGEYLSYRRGEVDRAIERIVEYIEYGAEALFFDDSIFWGGDAGSSLAFCRAWSEIRAQARRASTPAIVVCGREVCCEDILNLTWGAQSTTDLIASRASRTQSMLILDAMADAGCTYIYIGIESLAEPVIARVHKNVNKAVPWDERVLTALGMVRTAGIRVGSSVLFGLDGENQATIEETIEKIEELLEEGLLFVASPNILTYHPNTEATHLHALEDMLDYHSTGIDNRPPYIYFEEAFPSVISKNLTEADIWHIHEQTQLRWGTKRYSAAMPPVQLRQELAPPAND